MLKHLSVENFRSLRKSRVVFSPTGLTAIVGANGSGKSNLIKCLEFLGTIPRDGLEGTIRAANGVDAILPKALPPHQLRSTAVRFSYEIQLTSPPDYPADSPPVTVLHELSLQARSARFLALGGEKLTFSEPLRVQASIGRVTKRQQVPSAPYADLRELPSSWIIVSREHDGRVTVGATPPIAGANLEPYLNWFGLPFLFTNLKAADAETVASTLASLFSRVPASSGPPAAAPGRHQLVSLLDGAGLLTFSPQAQVFRNYLSAIRRFDLQLSQLRLQQDIATARELTPDGKGLPAAVRNLKSRQRGISGDWRRLASTLTELAPHVSDTRVSQLKSGQEFVQFIESKSGRPVESWQASDGTLRALAILLAVETHPNTGAILIEEPEQGLHPWAVRTLVNHLREVIAERAVQIVITTHSQQVLDTVSPEEVRVAIRDPDAGTTFHTIEEVAHGHQIEKGEVGRMWVAGLLGGVPSYR